MDNNTDLFLKKIAQIESNGGTNFNHQTIKSGPQAGQTAIGTYGLLPNTVDEIVSRTKDPSLKNLVEMSPEEQKTYLESNPDKEKIVAQHLAEHVLNKQGGDEEKAAFAWNQGHNLSSDVVDKRNYQDSPYVQKFNKISEVITPGTKTVKATPPPGQVYPLDVGGTAEGDKVFNYLNPSSSPSKRTLDLLSQQKEDLNRAMETASRGPFEEKTPEEQQFEESNIDPLTRGLLMGGPVRGVASKIAPIIPEIKPAAIGAFNRLKSYMTGNPQLMTPSEFIAKQSKNPDVMEVLKDVRKYAPPNEIATPESIQQVENTVAKYAQQNANDAAKASAEHMDEITDVLKKKK